MIFRTCRLITLNSPQKFREFLEGSNLISKLQAKHDLLKRTLGEGIVTITVLSPPLTVPYCPRCSHSHPLYQTTAISLLRMSASTSTCAWSLTAQRVIILKSYLAVVVQGNRTGRRCHPSSLFSSESVRGSKLAFILRPGDCTVVTGIVPSHATELLGTWSGLFSLNCCC